MLMTFDRDNKGLNGPRFGLARMKTLLIWSGTKAKISA